MIHSILIINNNGRARLTKFYTKVPYEQHEEVVRDVFSMISKRSDSVCNFLEGCKHFGKDVRLIYRRYATLTFVFAVDDGESELGVLDLIQVFVEALDRSFENVCELDLVFHLDKAHAVLDEIVMGGMVLETNLSNILRAVEGASEYEAVSQGHVRKTSISNPVKKS